jgi:biopolymer transport protein ExbD
MPVAMRFRKNADIKVIEGDLTPMIDMVFQLIAFFMVLINFSQSEQNDRVTLPTSELAKPAESPLEFPITLHMPADGSVIVGGIGSNVETIRTHLENEIVVLQSQNKSAKDANIIIRAHRNTPGGRVQELIAKCQDVGFEKFALRVKEEEVK